MAREDSHVLKNLYNKVIINEISKKWVDHVSDAVKDRELPFNNIFKGKKRIVIPLKDMDVYREIEAEIRKIPNFYRFDPQKKEVIKKIKLKPEYGGGEKEQRISFGKVVSQLKIPENKKKEYLDWYANYGTNLGELEQSKIYSIVISRHPVDVLRMSDMGNIESCHSQGGQYFNCAVQEAKTGGPIAYLVKTKFLEDVDLEADDLFADDDREVVGIVPSARLRIRRYISNEEVGELAVPETRIYGKGVEGFYDSVKSFFLEAQPEINFDTLYKDFVGKNYVKTGGTYADSSDASLFNQMWGVDVFKGSLPHDSDDESGESDGVDDRYEQFETELEHMEEQHSFRHTHTSTNVTQDDDYVFYDVNASISIDLKGLGITNDFVSDITSIEDLKYMKGPQWEKHRKFLNILEQGSEDFYSDLYGVYNGYGYMHGGDILTFYYDFGLYTESGDSGSSSENTDDYQRFLLHCAKKWDDNYNKIKNLVWYALYAAGFTESKVYHNLDISKELTNFKLDPEDNEKLILPVTINVFKKLETAENRWTKDVFGDEPIGLVYRYLVDVNEQYHTFMWYYLKNNFKKKAPAAVQTSFKKLFESTFVPSYRDWGIINTGIDINKKSTQSTNSREYWVFTFELEFLFDSIDEKVYDIIKFLDEHAGDIKLFLEYATFKSLGITNPKMKTLDGQFNPYLE